MDLNLLNYYFQNELYFQNMPMQMDEFITFCKKRGININKSYLEYLEKNKLFYPIFRIKLNPNDLLKIYSDSLYTQISLLKISYNENNVFLPQKYDFIPFSEYYDEEYDQYSVLSFYSSFQIYLLDKIINKKYSKKSLDKYNKLIDLLIAVQIYSPYGRSNMRSINIKYSEKKWKLHLKEFNLENVFEILNVDKNYIFRCYMEICSKLKPLLGSNDIIQLWKNISWQNKNQCIGKTRLGIEYLQWAMMLKQCIEIYQESEIYDVDELDSINLARLIDDVPSKQVGYTRRAFKNNWYYNNINETYEFNLNRKKLFYLANELTLDYHPRIIIFVEGKTEEILIPKFFNEFYANFEDFGFEIINIGGIGAFFSSEISDKQENKKYLKLLVSNFTNLINFNLNMWQAIPFFVGDNENNILFKLKEGKIFNLKDIFYFIHGFSINEYKFIFKYYFNDLMLFLNEFEDNIDFNDESIKKTLINLLDLSKNLNSSFIDEWTKIWDLDFELDNYSPEELKIAIDDVCDRKISLNEIKSIYGSQDDKKIGLKGLGEDIDKKKIEINEKLLENLIKSYNQNMDTSIFEKPIFKLLNQLYQLKHRYTAPNNTHELISNKKRIYSKILHNNQ